MSGYRNPTSIVSTPADPPLKKVAITPSDSADLTTPVRAIWVGTGGNLCTIGVNDADGESVIEKNIPDGTLIVGYVRRVKATGTTAGDLVGYV